MNQIMTNTVDVEIENKDLTEARGRASNRIGDLRAIYQRQMEGYQDQRIKNDARKASRTRALETKLDEKVDRLDDRIEELSQAIAMLQKEKGNLLLMKERARQEIISEHKMDDAALVKMIQAQRAAITALDNGNE